MTGATAQHIQPRRIQRKRTRGWRLPPGAVSVARPSKWGNPFRIAPAFESDGVRIPAVTRELAVQLFRERWERALATWPSARVALESLRGKDLACFCPLDQPCHADVLLELANR